MTKHPNENQLRSFIDCEGESETRAAIQAHLDECEVCVQKVQAMQETSARIRRKIEASGNGHPIWTTREARRKLNLLIEQKETEDRQMWKRLLRRPAIAGLVIVLVIGFSLAFPQVRAMATDFLKIFRVQQVQVIPVNLTSMPSSIDQNSEQIQALISDSAKYETSGEETTVQSASQASDLAGFNVRLPAGKDAQKVVVEPAVNGELTLNVERINQLLKEMGREDLALSPDLNGAIIDVQVPHSVASYYGTCELAQPTDGTSTVEPSFRVHANGSDCLALVQIPSPTIQAPDGLDLNKMGAAFFEMTGMTPDQAQKLSEKIDWSTTLVVPIPSQAATVSDVQVDGVTGTLIENTSSEHQTDFALVWVKDGILYCVTGNQSAQQGIDLANSLQ